jgi:hypothetical protein
MKRNARPQRTNALSRELEDELIVYNSETHQAHSLNHTAAAVWKACDGKSTVADMATSLEKALPGIDRRLLLVTLIELQAAGLLVKGTFSIDRSNSSSRRDMIRKMGKIAAVALPIVISIVVPTASMALSCLALGKVCTKNSDCCSGRCGILGLPPKVCF